VVEVVFGGTSYELSTYAKVNSGTDAVISADAGAVLNISRLETIRMAMSNRVKRLLMLIPCNNEVVSKVKAFL